jgi:hypothetical protein
MERLELGRGNVTERLVQPGGVEPGDPFDGRELDLGAGAPDAVGDQLGFVGIDERFGERVRLSRGMRLVRRVRSDVFG